MDQAQFPRPSCMKPAQQDISTCPISFLITASRWVLVQLVETFDWSFACLIALVIITTSIILAPIKSRIVAFWYWLMRAVIDSGVSSLLLISFPMPKQQCQTTRGKQSAIQPLPRARRQLCPSTSHLQ